MDNSFRKYPNVNLNGTVTIEDFVILGHPLRDQTQPNLTIGNKALIRSHSVIYAGTTIGEQFTSGHGILIRENCKIGNNVSIGSHTVIERDVIIEDRVRIHSNAFIPENTVIHHDAWIGPHAIFVNDPHPPCAKCMKGPEIGAYAKIGANTTIMDHLTIGENSIIGAGAVVTESIPANSIAVGNPAKVMKSIQDLACTELCDEKLLQSYLGTYFSRE
jgi:acetyltransferase-like isoleucine patch superfamily enzyme